VSTAAPIGFQAADGPALHGSLTRPDGARQPRPGLVLCHAFPRNAATAANVSAALTDLADRIATTLGWVVLVVACRGCRPSDGDFALDGWLADIAAATARLREEDDVVAVWLAGFGHGGSLALCAAADDPGVGGVITFGAAADVEDWARQPRQLLEFSRRIGLVLDPTFPRDLAAWTGALRATRPGDAAAALAPRPLTLVHGTGDEFVPVADARTLAARHGAADLRLLTGATHDLAVDPRAVALLMGWLDREWNRSQALPS